MSLQVLLVEDHPVVSLGVRHLIAQAWPEALIGEAETLAKAMDCMRGHHWELALLDLSLPDSSGLEGLVKLRRLAPRTPVLVLSMHDEAAYAARALQAGAAGYLTKDHATTELLTAIERVRAGGRYVSSTFAARLAGMLTGDAPPAQPHEALSVQEHRVMLLIAGGKAPSEIAQTMHLSVKTVGTYRARIRQKTGLASTADMARYCLQHGLIEPD